MVVSWRLVMLFVTLLHGFTPKTGVLVMNVWKLSFYTVIMFNVFLLVALDIQDRNPCICGDHRLGSSLWQNSRHRSIL
jgi:hypothetical protein